MNTTCSPVLVGIDLAKDSFAVAVRHIEDKTWLFNLDRQGLSLFERFVDDLGGFRGGIVFGLEASGPYTDLLLGWLLARNARVCLLNPLQVHRFRKAQTLRNTKTDAIDAGLIARYMDQVPEALVEVQAADDLQPLACEYESVTQQVARLKTQIRQQVYVLFKEISDSSRLFSLSWLRLLLRFPSAHAIANAKLDDLAQFWISDCCRSGRTSPTGYQSIFEMARLSISIVSPAHEIALSSKIRLLLHLLDEQKTLRKALEHAVRQAHAETYEILKSIPGLGTITVSLFLAQVRSLDRFAGHKQLAAYAGIDPTTYESGQYTAPSHISKRGSPHLRRTLYQMAQATVRYSNTFGQYYQSLRERGKPYRVAIIACANKLLRVIVAIARSKSIFQDAVLQPRVPSPKIVLL